MKKPISIQQDEQNPVPLNIVATSIVEISECFKKLTTRGGLTKEAVVVLISHKTQLSKTAVAIVLQNLEHLQEWACVNK